MYMSGDWGLLTWNGIQVNVVEMHLESAMRVEIGSPGAGGWAKSMAWSASFQKNLNFSDYAFSLGNMLILLVFLE